MRSPGSFRIRRRVRTAGFPAVARGARVAGDGLLDPALDAFVHGGLRSQRIVDSLRLQIQEAGSESVLRIRQVFRDPHEIYRVELELPSLSCQRTTLLGRDALEDLLEDDGVRAALDLLPGEQDGSTAETLETLTA